MEMEKNPTPIDGVIFKNASVSLSDVTPEDLEKINRFTLEPLKAEDVFVFKVNAGDNETDDRNFEPFNVNALMDLKDLYIGKTVIKDHAQNADNQIARIYDTELVAEPKLTGAGEPFTTLYCKCYMLKTESNADLIAEIKAGIKKEVSTSCAPKRAICSICGTDNVKSYCRHYPGRTYMKDDGEHVCYMTLDGAKTAYELSLVAVPAQPRAGIAKHYKAVGFEDTPDETPPTPPETETTENAEDATEDLNISMKMVESFLFTQKQEDK